MVVTMKIRQRRFKKSWFHEGRGAGKTDPPGGREKHAFLEENFLEKARRESCQKKEWGG